jgi:hypothetical protein
MAADDGEAERTNQEQTTAPLLLAKQTAY